MSDQDQAVVHAMTRVIADEIEAQMGVRREVAQWPALIADAILDNFEVKQRRP